MKEVWNAAVDIVADAVELTGDLVESQLKQGIKHIKKHRLVQKTNSRTTAKSRAKV
jgi:hypothetical protein